MKLSLSLFAPFLTERVVWLERNCTSSEPLAYIPSTLTRNGTVSSLATSRKYRRLLSPKHADAGLSDGISLDGQFGAANEVKFYSLSQVENGYFVACTLYGDNRQLQDVNLYMRMGLKPDVMNGLYDNACVGLTANKTTFVGPLSRNTNVYAAVLGCTDYSNVTIQCTSSAQMTQPLCGNSDMKGVYCGDTPSRRTSTVTDNVNGIPFSSVSGPMNQVRRSSTPRRTSTLVNHPDGFPLSVMPGSMNHVRRSSASSGASIVTALSDGVPLLGLSGSLNQVRTFALRGVAAGLYVICTTDAFDPKGVFDVDLFVTIGRKKDEGFTAFDCASRSATAKEICQVGPIAHVSTDVYVDMVGNSAYDNITIQCITSATSTPCGNGYVGNGICEDPATCCSIFGWCGIGADYCSGAGNYSYNSVVKDLSDGVMVSGLSGRRNQVDTYALRGVTAGLYVYCTTDGPFDPTVSNDVDLFIRVGKEPDLQLAYVDCASLSRKARESCEVGPIASKRTDVYIDILGYSSYNNVTILCKTSANSTPCGNGHVGNGTCEDGHSCCTEEGLCAPVNACGECRDALGYNYSYTSGVQKYLSDGIPLSGLSGIMNQVDWFILQDVPAEQQYLLCTTDSPSDPTVPNDVDLFLGEFPEIESVGCASQTGTAHESCEIRSSYPNIDRPYPIDFDIFVLGYSAYKNVTIQCSTSATGTPCGNGHIGNGICEDTNACCSSSGWCGTGADYCGYSFSHDQIKLSDGVPLSDQSNPENRLQLQSYILPDVAPGLYVHCTTDAPSNLFLSNDVDLFMTKDFDPDFLDTFPFISIDQNHCASRSYTAQESCEVGPTIRNNTVVRVYLLGYTEYNNVTILCTTSASSMQLQQQNYTAPTQKPTKAPLKRATKAPAESTNKPTKAPANNKTKTPAKNGNNGKL